VLGEVLDGLLRLLHPMVPFVTEELWTALAGGESLVIAPWPAADPSRADKPAEAAIDALRAVVVEVRRFRSDQGVKPSQRVPARITGVAAEPSVRALLRLAEPDDGFAATASLSVPGGGSIEFDLSGAVDTAAERARLGKDLATAEQERDRTAAKLGNESFTAKAPDAVVAKARDRLAAAEADVVRISAALAALPPE
jgi:valyl-tRNA synthetase